MPLTDRKFIVEIQVRGCSRQRIYETLKNLKKRNIMVSMNDQPWTISNQENFKVISPKLNGKDGLEIVKNVIHSLSGIGSRVDSSCNFIVNVDIKDYTYEDLQSLLHRYSKFESDIDSFMPPSRRGHSNLASLKFYQGMWDNDYNDIYEFAEHCRAEYSRNTCKINVSNITTSNPYVSFRHHSGTLNYDKALNWIAFVLNFTEMSKENNLFHEDHAFAGCNNRLLNYYIIRTQQFAMEQEENENRQKRENERRLIQLNENLATANTNLTMMKELDTIVRNLFFKDKPIYNNTLVETTNMVIKQIVNLTFIERGSFKIIIQNMLDAVRKKNDENFISYKMTYHENSLAIYDYCINEIDNLKRTIDGMKIKSKLGKSKTSNWDMETDDDSPAPAFTLETRPYFMKVTS